MKRVLPPKLADLHPSYLRSMVSQQGIPTCFFPIIPALCLAAFFSLIAGCASNPPTDNRPRIGHGAQEYLKITGESVTAVLDALHALDRVAAQTNQCPPKVVAAFSREVDQLQVESLKIRSRAQAIQARGNAYFEAWSGNPTSPSNPQSGKIAEYLPQMHQAFDRIKQVSQNTGQEFKPFLSGLRTLRVQLDTNPSAVGTNDTRELIRTTREHGTQVVQNLGALRAELKAVIPVLERAKAEANL
jgi:hypothetical protein